MQHRLRREESCDGGDSRGGRRRRRERRWRRRHVDGRGVRRRPRGLGRGRSPDRGLAGRARGEQRAHHAPPHEAFASAISFLRVSISLWATSARSEEHTSELQSQSNLVCRLLLEKKKKYETSFTLL